MSVFSGGGFGPGSGGSSALQHAYAMTQANVIRQATMLAYIDNFWVLGIAIFCLIPCVFLIKKSKPGVELIETYARNAAWGPPDSHPGAPSRPPASR